MNDLQCAALSRWSLLIFDVLARLSSAFPPIVPIKRIPTNQTIKK